MNGHHPSHKYYCTVSYSQKYYYIIAIYNNNTYSAGMKERCRDGCRTSLLIAGVVLVPTIFHILLSPCHPYITIHFLEMIFSTCIRYLQTAGSYIALNQDGVGACKAHRKFSVTMPILLVIFTYKSCVRIYFTQDPHYTVRY